MPERDAVQIDVALRDISGEDGYVRSNAWHRLVEAGTVALPRVVQAYHHASDRDTKLTLLSIVQEYRTPAALSFWAAVLAAQDDPLWKAALDGLVTLGGESSLRVLSESLAAANPTKREWIEEAIDQVRSQPNSM